MTSNYLVNQRVKTSSHGWVYKLLLYVSFVWVSLYPATGLLAQNFYFGYGNMLDFSSPNFLSVVVMILSNALIYWVSFEIIFYFYRWFLGFKIYSFIVPVEKLKAESRGYFIYRNIFYGIFLNLCFLFPFLHQFAPLVDLVITLIVLIVYAKHLNDVYAEPVIGHFVFKSFAYPVFIYEALMVISMVWEVL